MVLLTAIPYAFAAVGMVLWSRRSDRKQERYKHGACAALWRLSQLRLL